MSQAGRNAMATNSHRKSSVPGSEVHAPAATSAAAAARHQHARHLALALMAASVAMVLGGIWLLLWWLA